MERFVEQSLTCDEAKDSRYPCESSKTIEEECLLQEVNNTELLDDGDTTEAGTKHEFEDRFGEKIGAIGKSEGGSKFEQPIEAGSLNRHLFKRHKCYICSKEFRQPNKLKIDLLIPIAKSHTIWYIEDTASNS